MPFVPAPNVAMVEFRCSKAGQKIENRVMVDLLTEPTEALLLTLATDCWDWWENNHAALLPNSVGLREVVATSMHELNGPQVTYAPDTTTTGENLTGGQPNEVSLCVSLRTGSRGRSARGRWYMCGVPIGEMADENSVEPMWASACAASLNALRMALGVGRPLVIVSYRSNKVPRPGGPVYFPVSSATVVDNIVDSQRRRKPGVGE